MARLVPAIDVSSMMLLDERDQNRCWPPVMKISVPVT